MPTVDELINQVNQDPDFQAAPLDQQRAYLDKVLPSVDPDYGKADTASRTQYVDRFVMPALKGGIASTAPASPSASPVGDFLSGLGGEFVQQGSFGLLDAPEISTPAGGAGSIAGGFLGGAANVGLGAGLGTAIGGGLGLLGGPFAPITVPGGMAAGGTIGGIAGAFLGAGGRDVRAQLDEGRTLQQLNPMRTTIQGLGGGIAQAIPGGKLLKSIALDSGINAGTEALSQAFDGGIRNPLAIAQQAAFGAGGNLAGRAVNRVISRQQMIQTQAQPTQRPIGLSRLPAPPTPQALPTTPPAVLQGRVYTRAMPGPPLQKRGFFGLTPPPQRKKFETQGVVVGKNLKQRRAFEQNVSNVRQAVNNIESTSEQATLTQRINKTKKLVEYLSTEANSGKITAARAKELRDQAQADYNKLVAEYQQKFPTKTAQKQAAQRTLKDRAELNKWAEAGLKYRSQGGTVAAEYNARLGKFTKADRDKVNARIKEIKAEQAQAVTRTKDKQAMEATLRKEKAAEFKAKEKQKPQVQSPEAKQERAEQSKKETKESLKKAQDKGYEAVQSLEGKRRLLMKAKDENTLVIVEYEAQGGRSGIGGESDIANYRFKRDTVISSPYINKQGLEEIRVINNEGQLRTRLLSDSISGSNIVSVTRTAEKSKYAFQDGKVIETTTGREVPQVEVEKTFSKDIESKIEQLSPRQMMRVLRKFSERQATVRDIVDAAKSVEEGDGAALLDADLPANKKTLNELGEAGC